MSNFRYPHYIFPFMILAALVWVAPISAAVSVQGIFSDHMVVQRDIEVPVFGSASPNESVSVTLGEKEAEGTADGDGKFLVRLPAQEAGGPFTLTIRGSSNTLSFDDVYVGEVWVASGQSNMEYKVDCKFNNCQLDNEAQEIANSDYPLIRSININRRGSGTPQTNMSTSGWKVSSPQTVGDFSAIGYFFARELHENLPGVAIGIVLAAYGGSCIECYMSRESLAGMDMFASLLTQYERQPSHDDPHDPYNCYNGQIYPLLPYALKGVIWYQGESILRERDNMELYRGLQVELAESWRREWGQDMTFIAAQLAGIQTHSDADEWPARREAQTQGALMVPNAGYVVTIDIGDVSKVHPNNKQDVGKRMGLVARAKTYKQDVIYSGPFYKRMEIEGTSIRLFFDHAHGGLLLEGGNDRTFQIAGSDGRYVSATAVVDEDTTLLVSSPSVSSPANVRYAWEGLPSVSLYNKAAPELPASPFRTDAPDYTPAEVSIGKEISESAFDFRARVGNKGDISFSYSLPLSGYVTLELFDLRGNKLSLLSDRQPEGRHTVKINPVNRNTSNVFAANGLYYARLRVDGKQKVLPVVLTSIFTHR